MLERRPELDALHRRWERRARANLDLRDALARYAALWREAQALGAEPRGDDWLYDPEADLAVARAVNGLSPS